MEQPSPAQTFQTGELAWCERLDAAWQTWRPGTTPPQWQGYLPAPGQTCDPGLVFFLIQIDIEHRVKAGLSALLAEHYFHHPRLSYPDAQLDDNQEVELIRWEYQLRWKNDASPRASDYLAAFPHLAESLRDLRPRWTCSRCRKAITLDDETLNGSALSCPHCQTPFRENESSRLGGAPSLVSGPPVADTTHAPPGVGGLDLRDYELYDQLGSGGMGEVYRGRDPSLGRDLAVKVVRAAYRGRAEVEQRFIREARVTGSLQHPDIVPIHNLGRLPDGRLYYTMKLVRGKTLERILADGTPGRSECLPYLLGIFEKVCQAVAYAHSKGVIHRDLKPANVMVGAFGEVQVMDWGLAKVLSGRAAGPLADQAANPEEAASVFRAEPRDQAQTLIDATQAGQSAGLSHTGMALGTPAFMPPEQARGQLRLLDERADVFALGAILCVILTGKPPYPPGDGSEVLSRAQRGELAEAMQKLDRCGADGELVALCQECLAAERERRPNDGEGVAERVAAYRTGVEERLRRAELERAQAQVQAQEERKRRRLAVALIGTVLLLVLAGSLALWWRQHQEALADEAVARALAEGQFLLQQARDDPFDPSRLQAALGAGRKASEVAHTGASARMRHQADEFLAQMEDEERAARKDRQLLVELMQEQWGYLKGRSVRDDRSPTVALADARTDAQFATAFRQWGLDMDTTPTAEAAAQLQARPAKVVEEVVAALDDWAQARRMRGVPRPQWQRLTDLASALDTDTRHGELRDILGGDRLRLEQALGVISQHLRPVPVPVVPWVGQDRARLLQMAREADFPNEPVLSLVRLARALSDAGEEAEAEHLLRASISARPREVVLYHTLALLLTKRGSPRLRLPEALECYTALAALRPELRTVLAWYLNMAGRQGDALTLVDQLIAEGSVNPFHDHFNRGCILADLGRTREAIAAVTKANSYDADYPNAHAFLGYQLSKKGRYQEAVAAYDRAIQLEPKNAEHHYNRGHALTNLKDLDGAIKAYRQATSLDPGHLNAHINLAQVLREKGCLDEAIATYHKALDIDPRDPVAWYNLGNVLLQTRAFDRSIKAYGQAIALAPMDPNAWWGLGLCHFQKGNLDESIKAYNQAIQIDQANPVIYQDRGRSLYRKGDRDGAIADYRKSLAINPNLPLAWYDLGLALHDRGELVAAITAYRRSLALNDHFALAHTQVGDALYTLGDLDGALTAHRRAIKVDQRLPQAHYHLARVLFARKDLAGAVASLHDAIKLFPPYVNAHLTLGDVRNAEGDFNGAIAAYRKAIEGNPELVRGYLSLGLAYLEAGRRAALEQKLPALLEGREAPAGAVDALVLARMCYQSQKRYTAATRSYAAAFAADPDLAGKLEARHRYDAACTAVLASAGKGTDAGNLDDKERLRLRSRALAWLRADLANLTKLAADKTSAPRVTQRLARWRSDPELATVREEKALDQLPTTERTEWQTFWHEVNQLYHQTKPDLGP
jgi:serine/threonine-protein kinase